LPMAEEKIPQVAFDKSKKIILQQQSEMKNIEILMNELYPEREQQEFRDQWTKNLKAEGLFTVKDLIGTSDENWAKILSKLPVGLQDKLQKKFPRQQASVVPPDEVKFSVNSAILPNDRYFKVDLSPWIQSQLIPKLEKSFCTILISPRANGKSTCIHHTVKLLKNNNYISCILNFERVNFEDAKSFWYGISSQISLLTGKLMIYLFVCNF